VVWMLSSGFPQSWHIHPSKPLPCCIASTVLTGAGLHSALCLLRPVTQARIPSHRWVLRVEVGALVEGKERGRVKLVERGISSTLVTTGMGSSGVSAASSLTCTVYISTMNRPQRQSASLVEM
jgi:hypothetical protein